MPPEIEATTVVAEPSSERPDPFDRLLALGEVALVAIAGALAAYLLLAMAGMGREQLTETTLGLGAFMGLETLLTLALVALLLRLRGRSWSLLGLSAPRLRNAAIGLAFVPLLFGATVVVSFFFQRFAPEWVTRVNPLLELIQTPLDVAILLAASLLTGGFKEEVQRAFALVRFETHLGGAWLGLVLWTFFFALGHTYQGLDNAVGAGLLGLFFGLIYLWRRNLWAPIAAHSAFNVLTILIYWSL